MAVLNDFLNCTLFLVFLFCASPPPSLFVIFSHPYFRQKMDTHAQAAANEIKNHQIKSALGIKSDYKTGICSTSYSAVVSCQKGSAFDFEQLEKEKQERIALRQKVNILSHESNHKSTEHF